jgi:hypothetical protein
MSITNDNIAFIKQENARKAQTPLSQGATNFYKKLGVTRKPATVPNLTTPSSSFKLTSFKNIHSSFKPPNTSLPTPPTPPTPPTTPTTPPTTPTTPPTATPTTQHELIIPTKNDHYFVLQTDNNGTLSHEILAEDNRPLTSMQNLYRISVKKPENKNSYKIETRLSGNPYNTAPPVPSRPLPPVPSRPLPPVPPVPSNTSLSPPLPPIEKTSPVKVHLTKENRDELIKEDDTLGKLTDEYVNLSRKRNNTTSERYLNLQRKIRILAKEHFNTLSSLAPPNNILKQQQLNKYSQLGLQEILKVNKNTRVGRLHPYTQKNFNALSEEGRELYKSTMKQQNNRNRNITNTEKKMEPLIAELKAAKAKQQGGKRRTQKKKKDRQRRN